MPRSNRIRGQAEAAQTSAEHCDRASPGLLLTRSTHNKGYPHDSRSYTDPASGASHTAPHCHPHHWKFGPVPPRNGGVDASWRRMAVYPRAQAAVWRSTAALAAARPSCDGTRPSSLGQGTCGGRGTARRCTARSGVPLSDLHHSDFARLIRRPATAEQRLAARHSITFAAVNAHS